MNHSPSPHHKKNCNYTGKILSQLHVVRGALGLRSAARAIDCSKSLTSLKIYKSMSEPIIHHSVLKRELTVCSERSFLLQGGMGVILMQGITGSD